MNTYVVDTNVLLRTLQPAHSMYMSASRSIALLIKQGESLCVCPQSIYECWVVATRPLAQNGLGMTTDQIHSEIEVFKTYLSVLPDTPAIFLASRCGNNWCCNIPSKANRRTMPGLSPQ